MRTAIVMITILLSASTVSGKYNECPNEPAQTNNQPPRHRPIAWYTPVPTSTIIDGLALGVYAVPSSKMDSLQINGVNIELDPAPIIFIPFLAIEILAQNPGLIKTTIENPGEETDDERTDREDSISGIHKAYTTIKGVGISTGIITYRTSVSGLALNALCAREKEMKGVEISGLFNSHTIGNGLIVAPVNLIKKGKGVQIGLLNFCQDCNVVQIGLINRIGNRTTPFVNFKFRHRRRAHQKSMVG